MYSVERKGSKSIRLVFGGALWKLCGRRFWWRLGGAKEGLFWFGLNGIAVFGRRADLDFHTSGFWQCLAEAMRKALIRSYVQQVHDKFY